jgi:hypothetical protein
MTQTRGAGIARTGGFFEVNNKPGDSAVEQKYVISKSHGGIAARAIIHHPAWADVPLEKTVDWSRTSSPIKIAYCKDKLFAGLLDSYILKFQL